jgi:hypothetical protein
MGIVLLVKAAQFAIIVAIALLSYEPSLPWVEVLEPDSSKAIVFGGGRVRGISFLTAVG